MVYLIHENKKCNWGKLRDVKMNGYTNKERKGNDNRKRKEYVYGKYQNPQVWGIYFADLPKIEGSHILHGKDQSSYILIIFVIIRAQRLTCIQLQKN